MPRRLAALALCAAMPVAVLANTPPPLPGAAPAGQATLSFWGWRVYDAQLWVAPGFRAGEFGAHPFALQLTYHRAFSAVDIARRSVEEMARQGALPAAQAQAWQDQLLALLPDVAQGDRLAGIHAPGRGAVFFHNGRRLGEVADAEFARRFFGIWLSPASSQPVLRESLLAGTAP